MLIAALRILPRLFLPSLPALLTFGFFPLAAVFILALLPRILLISARLLVLFIRTIFVVLISHGNLLLSELDRSGKVHSGFLSKIDPTHETSHFRAQNRTPLSLKMRRRNGCAQSWFLQNAAAGAVFF
ncbi:MAG: hypothetical protein ABWZ40_07795 [Caulobacterales bacterium]